MEIKTLNRADIKKLNDAALNPSIHQLTPEETNQFVDFIVDLKYTSKEEQQIINDMPYGQVIKLAMDVFKKTFEMTEEEAKN